ncbi:MAG: tRNA uracil 4-sulfurtransferase ThiI [Christensenellales bacterium]
MCDLIMVRYGEIFLKGTNRPYFLKLLLSRVRQAVKPFSARVLLHDSRLIVSDMSDTSACMEAVRKVFGVHSVCPALEMEKDDFGALCAQAAKMMQGLTGSFKVIARRSDKRYFIDSLEINARVGEYVLANCQGLHVDVKKPEHVLSIEIRDFAYLYVRVLPGVGGMPVGSNGKAVLLLSGGIDSPVAGYMIAKRGVSLCAVHYYSFPYTGERAKEKVLDLARILASYCAGIKVYVVPFTDIQMRIHESCPDDYTTLIMRRYMMRIADRIASREGAQALITGESIGQVASQTMDAIVCTDMVTEKPVFRPLIGFDKIEIIDYAQRIGTFDTSSLPFEDCCTVFTPQHPVTHPRPDKTALAEAKLAGGEALIEAAIRGAEILQF